MSTMDVLMNVSAVNKKGADLLQLGNDIKSLMKDFDTTTQDLLQNGLRGQVQLSMGNAVDEVQPGMDKHADRIIAEGTAVKKVAQNTQDFDLTMSKKLNVIK